MNLHSSLWKQFIFAAMETVDICSWSFLKGRTGTEMSCTGKRRCVGAQHLGSPGSGLVPAMCGSCCRAGKSGRPISDEPVQGEHSSLQGSEGVAKEGEGGISKPNKSVFPLPVSELKKLCVYEDVDLLVLKTPKPTLHLNKGVSCPKYWLCRQSYGRVDISKIYICVLQGKVCVSVAWPCLASSGPPRGTVVGCLCPLSIARSLEPQLSLSFCQLPPEICLTT